MEQKSVYTDTCSSSLKFRPQTIVYRPVTTDNWISKIFFDFMCVPLLLDLFSKFWRNEADKMAYFIEF